MVEELQVNRRNLLAIVKAAYDAEVVLPEFQRSFVWERDDIQELLSSILQGYFIGTFLTLNTFTREPLFPFRTVEGLEDVNPSANPYQYPIVELVLDGQQRITSVFYALYAPENTPLPKSKYPHKFYLLLEPALNGDIDEAIIGVSVRDKWRITHFENLVDRHLALRFTGFINSDKLYKWLYNEQKVWKDEEQEKIQKLFEHFLNFMVPVVSLSHKVGTDNIVNIFERINRTGEPLSLFDLAAARLYLKGVKLRDLWDAFRNENADVIDTISPKKAPEFLLKAISILENRAPRKSNLLTMLDSFTKEEFEKRWEQVAEAFQAAFKRIQKKYGAYERRWIPYTTMIVPLAVMLYQLKELKAGAEDYCKVDRWYWASVFTQRYDSGVDTKSYQDACDIINWIKGEASEPDWLKRADSDVVDLTTVDDQHSAVYRGVMCLITLAGARDFLNGQEADLNTCYDDHIFPQKVYKERYPVDVILNRTLISKTTNDIKKDKNPSEFLKMCLAHHGGDENRLLRTLSTHFITREAYEALKRNDFDAFVRHREDVLKKVIQGAIRKGDVADIPAQLFKELE